VAADSINKFASEFVLRRFAVQGFIRNQKRCGGAFITQSMAGWQQLNEKRPAFNF